MTSLTTPLDIPPPLTRGQLYEAVWKTPVDRLSKAYGISGVGLAKMCKRHRIPLPKRGHWAKPEGRRRHPPPLPIVKGFSVDEVLLSYRPPGSNPMSYPRPRPTDTGKACSGVDEGEGTHPPVAVTTSQSAYPVVVVRPTIVDPHRFVVRTAVELRRRARDARKSDGPLIHPSWLAPAALDIWVSRESFDRALRIADALIKALESHGHAVEEAQDPRREAGRTLIRIVDGEDWFTFRIQEEVEPDPEVVAKNRHRKPDIFGRPWKPSESDMRPTGQLRLLLYEDDRYRRRGWGDGKKRRLENHLGELIFALEDSARRSRERREEWARQERERAEAERRAREAEECRRQEKARVDVLFHEVTAWVDARSLRQYLAEVRAQAGGSLATDSDLQNWLAWATAIADRMDPLPRRRPRAPGAQAGQHPEEE